MLVYFVYCFEECGRLWNFDLEGAGCSKQSLRGCPGRSLGFGGAESHADCGILGQGHSKGTVLASSLRRIPMTSLQKCGFLLSTKNLPEAKFKCNKLSYFAKISLVLTLSYGYY